MCSCGDGVFRKVEIDSKYVVAISNTVEIIRNVFIIINNKNKLLT